MVFFFLLLINGLHGFFAGFFVGIGGIYAL